MCRGPYTSNGPCIEPNTAHVTHSQQDFCVTSDGTKMIAAGISESGPEITVRIWVSRSVSAPEPPVSVPKRLRPPVHEQKVTSNQYTRNPTNLLFAVRSSTPTCARRPRWLLVVVLCLHRRKKQYFDSLAGLSYTVYVPYRGGSTHHSERERSK